MNKCPECGHQRAGDEYKCPKCDCFYSQLDEILATEAAETERRSIKGRLKAIKEADNSFVAFKEAFKRLKETTPKRTILTLAVIFIFIFALIVSVM